MAAAVVAVAAAAVAAAVVVSAETALGIAWRPELSWAIEKRTGITWIELLAENLPANNILPKPIQVLQERGARTALHGVSLSLGGAERPNADRLKRLAELALASNAQLVSEHLAFVRADGIESGHLLPLQRRRDAIKLIVENIQIAQAALPVPLAVENIASLFRYPDEALSEAEYLRAILESANCLLLLDVSNLHANSINYGFDAVNVLDELPLERIAYVHIAGGVIRDGFYHDTHAHPIGGAPIDLLTELCKRVAPPAVILERDDSFPTEDELDAELEAIKAAIGTGLQAAVPTSAAAVRIGSSRLVMTELPSVRSQAVLSDLPLGGGPAFISAPVELQRSVMRCLNNGENAPPGMDARELTRAASTLFHKRMTVVERCHPVLAKMIGDDVHSRFRFYARVHSLNADADGTADGYQFAMHILAQPGAHRLRIARYILRRLLANPREWQLLFRAIRDFSH